MAEKLSQRLSTFLESTPDNTEITIHILCRKGLSDSDKTALFQRLNQILGKEGTQEVLKNSGLVVSLAPVRSIPSIASLSDVEWVDVESQAPIDELLDGDIG